MREGRHTSEYQMVARWLLVQGALVIAGLGLALAVNAMAGVVLAVGASAVGAGLVVGYGLSRAKVKDAEAMAEPMRSAMKPTSRTV